MASAEFNEMLRQIKEEYPVLPDEEIRKLIKEYRETGDMSIRDKIILSNVGLAYKLVNKYQYFTDFLEAEDLFNETIEGITVAIDKFDFDKGTKFSTYAAKWIFQRITRCISNSENTIRIPIHFGEKVRKVRNYIHEQNTLGHTSLSIEEIMQETDASKDVVEYVLNSNQNIVSLNMKVKDDGNETEFSEFIPDKKEMESDLEKNETKNALYNAIEDKLTKKEQDIIMKRYGLNGTKRMTLQEIGDEYGLSKEAIRLTEEKAIKKLKRSSDLRMIHLQ